MGPFCAQPMGTALSQGMSHLTTPAIEISTIYLQKVPCRLCSTACTILPCAGRMQGRQVEHNAANETIFLCARPALQGAVLLGHVLGCERVARQWHAAEC